MSTALVLSNENMLVNLDEKLRMTDFYWPHIGQNNHLKGHYIKTFFWDYGNLISIHDDDSFNISPMYEKKTLSGKSTVESDKYGIKILIENCILEDKDIYLVKYTIINKWNMKRNLKFFINHDFYLKGQNIGDTACWYPFGDMVFHYKDDIYLGIGSTKGIDQYSCSTSHSIGGSGTLPNPNNGLLSNFPIEHGAVESTVGFDLNIEGEGIESFDYFIICGNNFNDCIEQKKNIVEKGIDIILRKNKNYWTEFLNSKRFNFDKLNNFFPDKNYRERVEDIYEKSILVIKSQIDQSGAVIAANDSEHIKYDRDTYEYLWPRDAALTISTYDDLGYKFISEKFFKLCSKLIEKDGYFSHKYKTNGNLGASWHSWVDQAGNTQLPIQEDETASVLWALWKNYNIYDDRNFISSLWEDLIKPAADFLCDYRYCEKYCQTLGIIKKLKDSSQNPNLFDDSLINSGLPLPSYDLWEEQNGIFTYTCASVYAALIGTSDIALRLGHHDEAEKYSKVANEVMIGINNYLYDKETGLYIHGLYKNYNDNTWYKSKRADASISGLWLFDVVKATDQKIQRTMQWLEDKLWNNNIVGGVLRYEDDLYYRQRSQDFGNPWFITALWFAQYNLKTKNYEKFSKYISWVLNNTNGVGLIGEQIDCETGKEISVKPLTWSHAEYIKTINIILN